VTVTVVGYHDETFITVDGPARMLCTAAAELYDERDSAAAMSELRFLAHPSLHGGNLERQALDLGGAIRHLEVLRYDPGQLRLAGEPMDDGWYDEKRDQFTADRARALEALLHGVRP
jgi:hypothetical protein